MGFRFFLRQPGASDGLSKQLANVGPADGRNRHTKQAGPRAFKKSRLWLISGHREAAGRKKSIAC